MSASKRFFQEAVDATLTAAAKHAEAARRVLRETQSLTPRSGHIKTPRHDLIDQIQELEGSLKYMGQAHPERLAHERRLEQLRALLLRWDQAPPMQQAVTPKIRPMR